jgi:large subunit ribosomal protein L18
MSKKISRIRRSKKTRSRIRIQKVDRLMIHKTPKHIYAYLVDKDDRVITSASSQSKDIRDKVKYTGNCETAVEVGKLFSLKAQELGIKKIAFDRSGFKYHGRVLALANAAREAGMEF